MIHCAKPLNSSEIVAATASPPTVSAVTTRVDACGAQLGPGEAVFADFSDRGDGGRVETGSCAVCR